MLNSSGIKRLIRQCIFLLSPLFLNAVCFSSASLADPTLVVDLDTGEMEIHVGDTNGIAPITKDILGCSWGGVGACTPALTGGDWPSFTGFQITSSAGSLNSDGNALSTPGDVPGMSVLGNSTSGYAEGSLFASSQFEPIVIPLSKSYDNSIDALDLQFSSVMGASTTQWNTIYVSGVPEPSCLVLGSLGILSLATRRRRRL